MTDEGQAQGFEKFDSDPASPRVRALAAVHSFLLSDKLGLNPLEVFEIAISLAGEILAQFHFGDPETVIADVPEALRRSIRRFSEHNPEIMAEKRRLRQ